MTAPSDQGKIMLQPLYGRAGGKRRPLWTVIGIEGSPKAFPLIRKVMSTMMLSFLGQKPASDLKVGDPAPGISLQTDEGRNFDLNTRKGHWTVLYFYPQAGTPHCTKQACAFRDSLAQIRALGAEIFGVTSNGIDALKKFKARHNLNFTLLADPGLDAIRRYGTKMPFLRLSKRWTFIVDPELKIRAIEKNVDPVLDATRVAEILKEFQRS
jgi:peroxiredoxin Q/BCP